MQQDSRFWMIVVDDASASAHLVEHQDSSALLLATGLTQPHDGTADSLLNAVDTSLSGSASLLNLPENEEPSQAAFILSPFWQAEDGKIISAKKTLLENLCKQLKLKPLGFTTADEALVEEQNQENNSPLNSILVHFSGNTIGISLSYLGKIVKRIQTRLDGQTLPLELIQNALGVLRQSFALPPQILVSGEAPVQLVDELTRHRWQSVGQPLFLHIPSVKTISHSQLTQYFATFIRQHIFLPPSASVETVPVPPVTPVAPYIPPKTADILPEEKSPEIEIIHVQPETLGFNRSPTVPIYAQTSDNLVLQKSSKTKPTLKLPNTLKLIPLFALFGLIVLLVLSILTSKATVTIFANPFTIDKSVKISLSTATTEFDASKGLVPASKKTFNVQVNSTLAVSGKKQTGEVSKGEVTLYNKTEKIQTIPKNSVFLDPNGRRFLLQNSTNIEAAKPNLETGTIAMGQTKTLLQAQDIGTQGNLVQDVQLTFQGAVGSVLAKVSQPFTGGNSQEVSVVSKTDRDNLTKQLNDKIGQELDAKIKTETESKNIFKSTLRTLKDRIEFNRELDEQATELQATLNANVSVFNITDATKKLLVDHYLKQLPEFASADINPDLVQFVFKAETIDDARATGTLQFAGLASPKLDLTQLASEIKGHSPTSIRPIILKHVPRAYDFKIEDHSLIKLLSHWLPFSASNIKIQLETQNL